MLGKPTTRRAAQNGSTVVVSLSLYLIILAFFILMNAISQPEIRRAEGVLNSLGSTFKSFSAAALAPPGLNAGASGFDAMPGFEDSLRELFESAFPVVRVTPSRLYDHIEVALPLESLFAANSKMIAGENESVLDRLAGILDRPTPGFRIELEILLSPLAAAGEAGLTLFVGRASALARELSARGVAAARIGAGIEHQEPEWMRFLFTVRPVDEPDAMASPTAGAAHTRAMAAAAATTAPATAESR